MAEQFSIPGLSDSVKGVDQLNKEFQKTIDVLLKVSVEGQKAMSSFKTKDNIKAFEKFEVTAKSAVKGVSSAYNGLTQAQNAHVKALQEQQRAALNFLKTEKAQTLETEKLKIQTREMTKAIKQQALEELGLVSAYSKVVQKMNEAGKVIQNLNAKKLSGTKLTENEVKSLKRAEVQFNKYNKAVIGADKSINRFQRNVGNYPQGLNAAAGAARNLASAMGLVGGAFLVVGAVKDAFQRIRDFDKSMQNLAGVLRTTRDELKPVEDEIIKVAGASVKTSREVASLSESLATLGKTPEQIIKLLKPVNDLSIGLNVASDEAGEFLVQMLNAFGASDSEANKYADTIATIRTSTSLDFQKMRDSFQYIAPISRILNKDLAYTGSIIGILADNSLKAESAGRLLATAQQRLSKQGKTLTEALSVISEASSRGVKETELLAIATKLFGAEGAKVGIILAQNTEQIELNAQAIRDNGGALDDLVNQQMESLDNKLKSLDSAYEKLILNLENGKGGMSSFFGGAIDLASEFLNRLTDIENAQSRVFESTGKKKGFLDYLKRISVFTAFVKTDYDDLVDKQLEFNALNNDLEGGKIIAYKDAISQLKNTLESNKNLSEDMVSLYNDEITLLESLVKSKSLETDKVKENTKSVKENKDALSKREKINPLEFKTPEESQKEFESYAKDIIKVLEDSFGFEVGKIEPIDLEGLYDKDLDSYLKLTDAKLNATKEMTEAQKAAVNDVFNEFGQIYGVDVDKFTALFDEKENTTQDYVNAAGEALKGLANLNTVNYASDLAQNEANLQSKLAFVESGSAAEIRLKEQAAERERVLKNRQAKQDKDRAIFNILINTATGVTAALTSAPPNVPLSVLVGAIGLASAAKVASTEIPQFKDGVTDFSGGLAVVGDGGVSEIIRTPDGRVMRTPNTDTLVNLPKGSDVFSSENDFMKQLYNLTDMNNIMFDSSLINIPAMMPNININNQGATAKDFDRVLSKHFANMQTNVVTIDKRGFQTRSFKGNSATLQHNNRVSFKGISV